MSNIMQRMAFHFLFLTIRMIIVESKSLYISDSIAKNTSTSAVI